LSPQVRVERGALVEGSVLLDSAWVGEGAVVRNAILDKSVRVEPGAQVGVDLDLDRQRFAVSAHGIVTVAKNQVVARDA
jgi:glucose-1-phosphate adenylyltransferase